MGDVTKAVEAAKAAFHLKSMTSTHDEAWRAAARAALESVEGTIIGNGDRSIVLPAPDPVEWVDKDQIRAGMGPEGCSARRSENPNWLLGHASNILALYRVLVGQNPWPDDPKAVERKRMTEALNLVPFEDYSTTDLAERLQELGFKLPEQPAA